MNSQENSVWIDRAEYERLKALDGQPQEKPIGSNAHDSTLRAMPSKSTAQSQVSVSFFTILTAIAAVVSFFIPLAILVFLTLGIITVIKALRESNASRGMKIGVGIVIAAILIAAGPFLLTFWFLLMWQIGCATGLGSCTTA